jgi:predicted DCC family thiol-disulfide oxidoreductase YuxK
MQTQKPLIFFDGLCHLCNRFVDEVIQRDRKSYFQFAPLQGETARNLLTPEECSQIKSILLLENNKKYTRSEAVLKVLTKLGGLYSLFVLAYVIPPVLRNALYDWVAKNRYVWFGERDFCRRPTAEEKDRLLP